LAGRLLRSLMFGITESDPATFAVAAGLFIVMGVAAGIAPALRAARVDPVIALRGD
jgi:putative ABC transport system permease protein